MDRIKKARIIMQAYLTKTLDVDKQQRPRVVLVPGSEGKQYQVIIRRPDKNTITCECSVCTSCGDQPCKGNTRTVCYHSIAAILHCVREKQRRAWVCGDLRSAQLLENATGGAHYQVHPQRGQRIDLAHTMYFIVR